MLRAVFFATRMEAERVLAEKKFGYKQICAEPFRVWLNRRNLIVITGIGLVNASVAFAWAAEVFGKKISMVKMVTDFSHECDISGNIKKMSEKFAQMEGVWI